MALKSDLNELIEPTNNLYMEHNLVFVERNITKRPAYS